MPAFCFLNTVCQNYVGVGRVLQALIREVSFSRIVRTAYGLWSVDMLVLWVTVSVENSFEQALRAKPHTQGQKQNVPASPSKAVVSLPTIGLSGLGNLKLNTRDYLDNPPLDSVVVNRQYHALSRK